MFCIPFDEGGRGEREKEDDYDFLNCLHTQVNVPGIGSTFYW